MKKHIAIIGGGPGGYTAALEAARLGAEVTLIEKKALGGVCLHYGCIPSKIMKHSADLLESSRRADQFGVSGLDRGAVDLPGLMAGKQRTIGIQEKGIEQLLKQTGVRVMSGTAVLSGKNSLSVALTEGGEQSIEFDKLIIATGSVPRKPPSFPFDGSTVLTSDEILDLTRLPSSLLIIGGGIIGCEFACIMRSFGVEVTVVEALDRLLPLPSVDTDISRLLLRQFKKFKITTLLNTSITDLSIQKNMAVASVAMVDGSGGSSTSGQPATISAEQALVCIGRSANTKGLNLERGDIATDPHGWIMADQYFQTSNANILAIGDVLGPDRSMLAHTAAREGKVAAANCLCDKKIPMDYDVIPTVIFSRPEIGCVGFSEQQAFNNGLEIVAKTVQFRTIGMAHVLGEIDGMAKIIAERNGGRILGVHVIGPRASDIVAEGALAVRQGCTVRELADTIHAHPTLAEILMETAAEFR